MSRVKFSDVARQDVVRLRAFLAQYDAVIADRAIQTIFDGIETLSINPFNGSPVADRPMVRKLVISFGATGYLVFHKYYEQLDVSVIATILHQKEFYEPQTIGLTSQ